MINLLHRTSKHLAQEIRTQRYKIEMMEIEIRHKERELAGLKEREAALQEKMDEFCEDIAEVRPYEHQMKITDSMRLSGLLMELLERIHFDTESLRASGEHFSEHYDVIRVFLPPPHRGNYQIHIVPEKDKPHTFKERK